MNDTVNFPEELQHIVGLLNSNEHTVAAKECVWLVEQALQHVLKENLPQLDEKDRLNVKNAERRRGRGKQGIANFTMGQLINVIVESHFFEALTRVSGRDLSRVRLINFDELRKLRNKFIHEPRKASQSEAEFLFECLRVMLTDFGIVSPETIHTPVSGGGQGRQPQPVETPLRLGMQLEKSDFQTLTHLVQNLPEFGMERDRRRLVAGALEGESSTEVMLARLDLGGSPMGAAIETVRFLQGFGQVADGKQALGVFLNFLKPYLGGEQAEFIETLFTRYPLDAPVISDRPLDQWRGKEDFETIKEIIVGENTLRPVYMLEMALEAAKSVAHLRVRKDDGREALGTGFLIAHDLLMTNNHVIATSHEALNTEYSFNYQLGLDGRMLDVTPAKALNDGKFYTNPELDFTIVQLADSPDQEFGTVQLKPTRVQKDDRVAIIQHPGGHFKQISMQNNFVAYADVRTVQYITSTMAGSSGSPVFDQHFYVVAIHHSGGHLKDPQTGQYELRNEGTSACAILEDIKRQAPRLYDLIKGEDHAT